MRNGTYYLNNHGDRWVNFTNGKKETITLQTESGNSVTRTILYCKQFGNFAIAYINYKGKRIVVDHETILED